MSKDASSEQKNSNKAIQKQYQTQLAKLAFKTEAELEMLDCIRDYMARRSELESQHSKNIEKLAKTVSARRFKKHFGASAIPLMLISDATSHPNLSDPQRGAYAAFANLIAESELNAKKRMEVSQTILTEVNDVLKEFSRQKITLARKNTEFGNRYHNELWQNYEEVEKLRMAYDKATKESEIAQKRYDEALKKPKSGLKSLKTLVIGKDAAAVAQKLKTKSKEKLRIMNDARNEYLLALTGLNAIHQLYEQEDLPLLMEKLDGKYFVTLQKTLSRYVQVEKSMSSESIKKLEDVQDYITAISREQDNEQFLQENAPVFKPYQPFVFEQSGLDQITEIVTDDFTKISLGKKLGELIVKDDALTVKILAKEKELQGAVKLLEGIVDVSSQTQPLELVTDIQNTIDMMKCQKRNIGSKMSILKSLDIQPIMPELNADGTVLEPSEPAKVVFNYLAEDADQLNVNEGDEVEIMKQTAEETKEGWIKVKNVKTGAIGLLPERVIEKAPKPLSASREMLLKSPESQVVASPAASPDANLPPNTVVVSYEYNAADNTELTLKVGDKIECLSGIDAEEEWWEGKNLTTGEIGVFPVLFTKGWKEVASSQTPKDLPSLARQLSMSNKESSVLQSKRQSLLAAKAAPLPKQKPRLKSIDNLADHLFSARVLFAYESTCPGELTIEVGEIITDISVNTGSDQWWEGNGKHGRGQFPATYAAPIKETKAKARALYDYMSENEGDLSFKAGDIIELIQAEEADWWDGEINGTFGQFPATYVEKLQT